LKKLVLLFGACLLFGCTKANPILTPVQQVGCDIEKAVTTSFASGVGAALTCGNIIQIQADLQKAFGNANLCSGMTTTTSKDAKAVHTMGIVGNLACPVAVSAALGFLSNSIPANWACSASASASTLGTTLVTLCETAVPL
jgi:hypothetical protein